METKDHYRIAQYCWEKCGTGRSAISKAAFFWGNVEPDINLFTYFRKDKKQMNLKGHNYENVRSCIHALFGRLSGKTGFGMTEFYRSGVLLHYIADSFTYAHNQMFQGSLKEHTRYERRLHRHLEKMLQKAKETADGGSREISVQAFELLHEEYCMEKMNVKTDCVYILKAADCFCRVLAAKGALSGRKMHAFIRNGCEPPQVSVK